MPAQGEADLAVKAIRCDLETFVIVMELKHKMEIAKRDNVNMADALKELVIAAKAKGIIDEWQPRARKRKVKKRRDELNDDDE